MITGMMLVILVSLLFLMISYKKLLEMENLSVYECGFNYMCSVRSYFSYRFFLISILFLIFDVEIALMLPIPWSTVQISSLFFFFFFICILVLGLVYEYSCGSLDWL